MELIDEITPTRRLQWIQIQSVADVSLLIYLHKVEAVMLFCFRFLATSCQRDRGLEAATGTGTVSNQFL